MAQAERRKPVAERDRRRHIHRRHRPTRRRTEPRRLTTPRHPDSAIAPRTQWRSVADQPRPKLPKLATLIDDAEPDVLAYMCFPHQHRAKLHSTNPLERLNGEIKRRTEVVGLVGPSFHRKEGLSSSLPNEAAITRLVGAILLEQNDEWAVQRARYMTLETMAPMIHNPLVSLSAVPA
jgi:putative transposase